MSGWLKGTIKVRRSRDVAVHQQIADQIERLITAGRLTAGQQLPTHKELAKILAVHPMTVGRSYSQLQSQGVIMQQRGRGTFVGEADRVHRDLVVLLPKWSEYSQSINNAYSHQQFLAGMEEACHDIHAHLRILTVPTQLDEAGLLHWSADIRKHHSGVLTVMPEHLPLLSHLALSGFPVLLYHRPADVPSVSNCMFGWYESLKLATEHLIAQGRKRITYLGPTIAHPIPNHDGFDGFLAAMQEAAMPYYPNLSVRFAQSSDAIDVAKAVEQAIQSDRIGDAIVCHAALGQEAGTACVRLLQQHGRRVPEDVAVIGFEEDTTGSSTDPPLTWLPIPRFEMGKQAVQMIHQIMQNPDCAPLRTTFVPRLVPGRSCGGFPDGNGRIEQVYSSSHAQPTILQDAIAQP